MKQLLPLTLLLLVISCGKGKETAQKPVPTIQGKLIIDNPELYDPKFLKCLQETPGDTLRLKGNGILGSNDTIYFPEKLTHNQKYQFTARKGMYSYNLFIMRKNLTTIDYNFIVSGDEKSVDYSHKGTAVLYCGFVQGKQNQKEEPAGNDFSVSEFIDGNRVIIVGVNDDKGRLMVMTHFLGNEEQLLLRENH